MTRVGDRVRAERRPEPRPRDPCERERGGQQQEVEGVPRSSCSSASLDLHGPRQVEEDLRRAAVPISIASQSPPSGPSVAECRSQKSLCASMNARQLPSRSSRYRAKRTSAPGRSASGARRANPATFLLRGHSRMISAGRSARPISRVPTASPPRTPASTGACRASLRGRLRREGQEQPVRVDRREGERGRVEREQEHAVARDCARRAARGRSPRSPWPRCPRRRATRARPRRCTTWSRPPRRRRPGVEREERRGLLAPVAVLRDVEVPAGVPLGERVEEQVGVGVVGLEAREAEVAVDRTEPGALPQQRQRRADPEGDADADERPERPQTRRRSRRPPACGTCRPGAPSPQSRG